MRGPKVLLDSEDNWVTDIGAWFPGERVVFRGTDLLSEFRDRRWMELLLFGITGRRFTDAQCQLMESLWVLCVSYPEPRIWNNRVSALGGTARTTGALAIAGSLAVSEAEIYGNRPIVKSFEFLRKTLIEIDKGGSLPDLIEAEIRATRMIPGYGRPVVNRDERIGPLVQRAERLGFSGGAHLKLAFDVEEILQDHWRQRMNIAAVASALAADLGFTDGEWYLFVILSYSAGFFPIFIDATHKNEGAFFPLRCQRLSYEGHRRRVWDEQE